MTLTASIVSNKEYPSQEPDPEITVVKAEVIQQHEEALPQPTAPPPQTETPSLPVRKEKTGFDILCCGDDMKTGVRVKPGTNLAIKLCGNTHIILPERPPQGAHYKFIMINLCGDAKVCVPKNTTVTMRRIALCGNRSIDVDDDENVETSTATATSTIKVTITIVQLCGDVHIMHHHEEDECVQ